MKLLHLFWLNLALLALWLLSYAIGTSLHLEFANPAWKDRYEGLGALALTLLPASFLLRNLSVQSGWQQWLPRVAGGLFAGLTLLFLIGMASLSNMCAWSDGTTVYRHHNDPEATIIERWFGCGATDSSPANRHLFRTKPVMGMLRQVQEIRFSQINRREWDTVQTQHPEPGF